MTNLTNYIALEDCINRHIYKIYSRNLEYGVFRADTSGFIGIREKFSYEYLFEEYHHDRGSPFGTVYPLEDIGILPDNIEVREYTDHGCYQCGGSINWDRDLFEEQIRANISLNDKDYVWPWICENGCIRASKKISIYELLFDYLKEVKEIESFRPCEF